MSELKAVTIIGFGSQAKAWALNLRDSGIAVSIALRKGSTNLPNAQNLGFKTILAESNELKNSTLLVMLIPDDQHSTFLSQNQNFLPSSAHIVYAHGFSLSKHSLEKYYPQFKHSLLAPKAIASEVRFQYEVKGKIGAAYHCDSTLIDEINSLAKAAGITALYKSTPLEECQADLFSEQSLLCSILPYVALESFNTLRKNNISSEVAFMECFLELKSISHALVTLGPEAFFKLISPNALIGSQKGRQLLINDQFKKSLDELFNDVKSGKFFTEVERDADQLRKVVIQEWDKEELTHLYKKLKAELIPN